MDYDKANAVNISMILMSISMLIYNNSYLNVFIIAENLIILIVAGFLLFTRFKIPNSWLLVDLEFFFSLIENFYFRYSTIIGNIIIIYPLYYQKFFLITSILFIILFVSAFLISRIYDKVPEFTLIYFIVISLLFSSFARLGTDEEMIDYYSAHVFLEGMNPYIPSNTASVYSHFPFFSPVLYGTPLTTGGVVTNLGYPALAFLIQVPSNLFHFNPNYINTFFYLAFIIALYISLRKRGIKDLFPFLGLPILINANYLYFSEGGITDIIWIFFTFLSLQSNRDSWKGIFYGLALSLKQIPLVLLPFYLYHLKKERHNVIEFLVYSLVTFLVFNIYFIVKSPFYYFTDLISPETKNLLLISDGISQISAGNIFFLFKPFFDIAMVIIFIGEFYLFVKDYEFFRDSWVGFPFFIFLFNYRSLWNYLVYWPLLLFGLDVNGGRVSVMRVTKAVGAVFLLLVSFAVFFHYGFQSYDDAIHIEVIHVKEEDGLVKCILANVSFVNDPDGLKEIKPLFRIFPYDGMFSLNGMLWKSNSTFLTKGEWEIVNITPYLERENFPVQMFEINAYYGNLLGYTLVNI